MSSTPETTARFVSAVSSPFVTLPVFGLVAIGQYSSGTDFLKWSALYLLPSIALPMAYVLARVKSGKITDVHIAMREQRSVPFALATAGALVTLLGYLLLQAPRALIALTAALLGCGVAFSALTRYSKVSIHAAALVGSSVILSIIVSPLWILLLLLLPAVVWARLKRQRHSLGQALGASAAVAILAGMTVVAVWR